MGGSETYARRLLDTLTDSAAVDVIALVPESAAGLSTRGNEVQVRGLVVRDSTAGRLLGLARARVRASSIRKQTRRADVIHFPFTVPAVRPGRGQAFVMTVHDTQHKDLPELFSRLERFFRVFTYDRAARRADAVITISEFSKRGIERHLGVPADRIHVAPLGVDTSDFVPNLGEREPFVFYPARGWPHKNHGALIDAMAIVRRTHPDLRLVLTGGGVDGLGDVPEWVENRGLVSHDELLRLYRSAAVLAFPSLYEGFGLPPLEAMASGCPVAASNAGSLPEVCGDAAVLFDPTDVTDIARGIVEAMERGDDLVRRGLERVTGFTWDASARAHEAAYRAAFRRASSR